MKNSQTIYETVIDGRVIRGTYAEVARAIREDRENR